MEKIVVAAVSENGVIGSNGNIPWHSREDLQYFKSITMGYPVIMGRKTFESLKKPLKGRLNIVLTRNLNASYDFEDVKTFNELYKAFAYLENIVKAEKVFIIGGSEIYSQAISSADRMSISRMNFKAEGNVYFPEIDWNEWQEEDRFKYQEFDAVIYKRIHKENKN
ncbi:MAG: dihydrofolate reductase [Syntrophothermus sp.]